MWGGAVSGRSLRVRDSMKNDKPEAESINWWDADDSTDEERASALLSHARDIEQYHQEVHENNLLYAQMYANRELPTASFDWGFGITQDVSLSPITRLSENLSLSIVETFVSQIGKMRPKATVVLKGAPWSLRRAAKMADRWLYSAFLHLKAYTKGKMIFRDGGVFGFGCARVDVGPGDKLCIERVFPDDVLVDQRECLSGRPPVHVMVRRVMTYAEAASRFGLDEETLEKAGSTRYLAYRGHGPGHVVVVEGWRRAVDTSGGVEPGRHTIAIEGRMISDEVWSEKWIPLVFFHWTPALNGWYCPSVVEQIFNYQLRLNEINERIREAQHLMSVPRILVPKGSDINVNQITNEIGKFISYTGPLKPEVLNWQAMSAEIYQERDRLVRSCYEFMGISQLSSQSKAPESTRFDSAPAFREFNQIEQARFTDLAQRFEEFYLDLAETIMRVMHKRGKVSEVMAFRTKGGIARSQVIDWSELDLDEASYYLTIEASSSMNQTPAARRDILEQMRARGEITAEEYAQHATNPDLEQIASLAAAASEDIDRVIDLLEQGEYEAPDEMQDLVNGLVRVHHAYLGLRAWEGVPMDVFENFEAWMLHAKSIVAPEPEEEGVPMPPNAATAAVPGMMPGPEMMGPGAMPMDPSMGGGAPLPS